MRATVRGLTARAGRVECVRLRGLAAMDARDDVVPKARAGQASIAFQQHALGVDHATARRDSTTAQLLDPDTGDLKVTGAAYAAGTVLRGHVDVAVRAHRDLGEKIREELIPVEGEAGGGGWVRRVEVVDAFLAAKAHRLSVKELDRLARALVEELNPKTPAGAHERRFLYASPDANGNLVGKFACAATQGALILAVLAAGNAPRPGLAIDPDGVERVLPDTAGSGAAEPGRPDRLPRPRRRPRRHPPTRWVRGRARMPEPWPDTFGQHDESDESEDVEPEDVEPGDVEPEAEGEYTVVREPGVLSGPYPPVKILVTVGVEQLAAALAATTGPVKDPNVAWSFAELSTKLSKQPPPTPPPLSETVDRWRGGRGSSTPGTHPTPPWRSCSPGPACSGCCTPPTAPSWRWAGPSGWRRRRRRTP